MKCVTNCLGQLTCFGLTCKPLRQVCSTCMMTLLCFAHTLGEFGVVLMIGGNIPGETRVLSVALFEHVEQMNYQAANRLALTMMAIALATVLLSQWSGRRHDRF